VKTLQEFSGVYGMGDKFTSEELVLTKVRNLEERWKELVRNHRGGSVTTDQYLRFEIPLTESILRSAANRSEMVDAAKTFAGARFFLRRASLPALVLSIDDSGIIHVESADETGIIQPMPGIEFKDPDLYIEGILGLSSREKFMRAYVSGGIELHELHRFRSWAPYVLAKLLKINRNVYHAIVCNAAS
jgi:hypothetical protein